MVATKGAEVAALLIICAGAAAMVLARVILAVRDAHAKADQAKTDQAKAEPREQGSAR